MEDERAKENELVDTTDCLEAVSVFRGWKNLFFGIIVFCLIFLQISFWLVDTGYVRTGTAEGVVEAEEVKEAAAKVVADANAPAQEEAAKVKEKRGGPIKFEHIAWFIRFLDFILIPVAALYCLTMLFSLKVSLLGRLGGINHICRAFFLSLAMLVLLLPWQRFFSGVVVGAVYTPGELAEAYADTQGRGILWSALYYLRFTGYWVLVMLFVIFAQVRSSRWTKAILKRLEII